MTVEVSVDQHAQIHAGLLRLDVLIALVDVPHAMVDVPHAIIYAKVHVQVVAL